MNSINCTIQLVGYITKRNNTSYGGGGLQGYPITFWNVSLFALNLFLLLLITKQF